MDGRDVDLAHVLLTTPLIHFVLRGHFVVFGEEFHTQIINIYNVNQAIIQSVYLFFFHNRINKLLSGDHKVPRS